MYKQTWKKKKMTFGSAKVYVFHRGFNVIRGKNAFERCLKFLVRMFPNLKKKTLVLNLVQRENCSIFFFDVFLSSFCQIQKNRPVCSRRSRPFLAKEMQVSRLYRCSTGSRGCAPTRQYGGHVITYKYLPIPDWRYVSGIYIRCYLL